MARLLCLFVVASLFGACNREVAGGKADGPAIFDEVCARCHGSSGVPEPSLKAQLGVSDLTDPAVQARLSDDAIRQQIRKGSDNRRMPAFDASLTAAQIEAVVAHVRTLVSRPAE